MSDIEENRHNWEGPPIVYAPRDNDVNNNLKIADLFCGAGGISEGFRMAGFCSVLGVDVHNLSIDTYRHNHSKACSILGNVKKINGQEHRNKDILDIIKMDDYGEKSRLAKIMKKVK